MKRTDIWRIIDANLNRAVEGIRVIEEVGRFIAEAPGQTETLRRLRHNLRTAFQPFQNQMLHFREATEDIGKALSQQSQLDRRAGLRAVVSSNFKRVQEALRALEEYTKLVDQFELGKQVEAWRFQVYTIEKEATRWWRPVLPAGIYGITAEKYSRGRSNLEVVEAMLAGGVSVVQYREKPHQKSFRDMLRECEAIRRLTADAGVLFIVNDHVDLALLVDADGVHVGQDDYPVSRVRDLIGEKLIGVSTHSPEQAQQAIADGADYIGVGPLFPTNTKEDVCDPVGLSYLEYAVREVSVPFVAIGGIKELNLPEVVRRGAKTVALVTEIVGAENITEKVKRLNRILQETNCTDNQE